MSNLTQDISIGVTSRPFGRLPTGEAVEAYALTGAGGLSLQVITYGAIVTHLRVPDRHGEVADVVLGFNSLNDYLRPNPYFGAIAGRVAGRITGAQFTLDGRTYPLHRNEPPNHLHGGVRGFDKRLWTAMVVDRADGSPSVRLARVSRDGEEQYPGSVSAAVTYTITADNRFIVEIEATTDRPTPFSLTQHSYFNLGGEGQGSIEDHELAIYSSSIAAVDEKMTLLGRRESVVGQACDLRHPRRLGDVLPNLPGRHGDLYFIKHALPGGLVPVARLIDPSSGRVMAVSTTEDCLQLYTGCALDDTLIGKAGKRYESFAGLCLECEGYPDGANTPALGDIIFRPGETFRQMTEYQFSNL